MGTSKFREGRVVGRIGPGSHGASLSIHPGRIIPLRRRRTVVGSRRIGDETETGLTKRQEALLSSSYTANVVMAALYDSRGHSYTLNKIESLARHAAYADVVRETPTYRGVPADAVVFTKTYNVLLMLHDAGFVELVAPRDKERRWRSGRGMRVELSDRFRPDSLGGQLLQRAVSSGVEEYLRDSRSYRV